MAAEDLVGRPTDSPPRSVCRRPAAVSGSLGVWASGRKMYLVAWGCKSFRDSVGWLRVRPICLPRLI